MNTWETFKSEFEEGLGFSVGTLLSINSKYVEIDWEEPEDLFNSLTGFFKGYYFDICHDVSFAVSRIKVEMLDLYDVRWGYIDKVSKEKTYFKTVVSTPLQAVTAILLESPVSIPFSPQQN